MTKRDTIRHWAKIWECTPEAAEERIFRVGLGRAEAAQKFDDKRKKAMRMASRPIPRPKKAKQKAATKASSAEGLDLL